MQVFYLSILKPYLKKIIFAFFATSLLISLTGCEQASKPSSFKQNIFVFGTIVNIDIRFATVNPNNELQANQAINEIEQTFHQLHKQWHAWDKDGNLYQINQAIAKQQSIVVDDETKQFIQKSQLLSKQSNGYFDPGIGQLIRLWSFHSKDWQGPPPSQQQLSSWLTNPASILDIQFNGNKLSSSNPAVSLDFGANAKGLALNKAINILKKHNIKHAIVNIGGDMQTLGLKPLADSKFSRWKIGIQSPFQADKIIAVANLPANISIVTSGTYQRYFNWQGKRYSHLINPKTAQPADSFSSVTVLHQDAIIADSAATAILIAGQKNWQAIAQQMGISEIMIIQQDGTIIKQSNFISLLE